MYQLLLFSRNLEQNHLEFLPELQTASTSLHEKVITWMLSKDFVFKILLFTVKIVNCQDMIVLRLKVQITQQISACTERLMMCRLS